ncbi:MAG: hypothetical protein V4773_18350 [Verrucomicrobiota bacterium]
MPALRNLKTGVWIVVALLLARLAGAAEQRPQWPDAPPAQLAEDLFGVRFRQMRLMDGNKAALTFLNKQLQQAPKPHVKAYAGWCGSMARSGIIPR